MRFALATARKDLRRSRRNLGELVLWMGIPLIIGGVIVLAFGGSGGGPAPEAHVLVVDEDDTLASNFLLNAMSQEDSAAPVRAEPVTMAEGRRRIDKGEASALLVVPEGFGAALLDESPTTLRMWVNPAQRILPGLVEEMLSLLRDAVFYLHRLFGPELQLIAAGPAPGSDTLEDLVVAAMAVDINQRVSGLVEALDPMPLDLEVVGTWPPAVATDEPEDETPGGFGVLFLPSVLMMSMLFMSNGQAGDLWLEREGHTLRRVASLPRSLLEFTAGKAMAAGVLMLAVNLVGFVIGYGYLGLTFATLPVAVLWNTLAGVMLFSLMTAVRVSASSRRGGEVVGMILIFPLMMLGGSFFPFEAMPGWMRAVGEYTPNGYALVVLKDIIRGLRGPAALGAPLAVLAALTLAFSAYNALRLRRFARS